MSRRRGRGGVAVKSPPLSTDNGQPDMSQAARLGACRAEVQASCERYDCSIGVRLITDAFGNTSQTRGEVIFVDTRPEQPKPE